MDELRPLSPQPIEIVIGIVPILIATAVLVASYRRNRCLFDRTVLESTAIAIVSAILWPFWIIGSITSWRAISVHWAAYRRVKRARSIAPGRA